MNRKTEAFGRLLGIMDELREKCPWDKKQTMESLRHLTIEETYELAESILENNPDKIKKEIGDLLLHVVFYARIASEKNQYDIADVINSLCDKLIHRHPHIYGDVKVRDEEDVKKNWEQLKMREGKESVLSGVPDSLPALIKAYRIQDKAAQVKFEWEKIEDEFGDLLFALVNYSRFLKIDPESAHERTNIKFIRRFKFIEERAEQMKKTLHDMTLEEMDAIWNEAKLKGL